MNDKTTTYKLSSGASIRTNRTPTPVNEWMEEGVRLFGHDFNKWKFKCPICGHVASIQDFRDAGAKDPNVAYQECIGRYKGAGAPGNADGNPEGCNWAAYGLFGIPNNKGRLILADDGTVVEAFDYAREEVTP